MTYDRKDFTDSLTAKHDRKRAEIMPMVRLLAGAKPVMEQMMFDDRWTRYQQTLQGLVERWKAQRDSAREKLGSSGLGDVELRKLNTDVVAANAAIAAWELAIELPSAIAKGAEDASKIISDFEKKNENAAGQANP